MKVYIVVIACLGVVTAQCKWNSHICSEINGIHMMNLSNDR